MKLQEFLESHDKAIISKISILELICEGHERLGHDLIDIDKLNLELDNIFSHIEFLEKTISNKGKA